MKLAYLFLFSVFVGVAFGKKLECLNKEVPACVKNMTALADPKVNDQCLIVEGVASCFEISSQKCKDDAPETIKKLVALGRDVCNKDSQMSKDLEKYIPCLKKPAFATGLLTVCVAEYIDEYNGLGKPDMADLQPFVDKFMKFLCPKREKAVNCAYGQIKKHCGDAEETFFRKLVDPLDGLVKESCTDSASIPSISMALVFLHLLIAVFSLRKVF